MRSEPRAFPFLVLASVATLFLLAGCAGDSGGHANVSFNGSGNGSTEDSTHCDADGTILAHGTVDNGQVTIRVKDGDGREVYSKMYDGGFNVDTDKVAGASGSWKLTASRSSDTLLGSEFKGDYDVTLNC